MQTQVEKLPLSTVKITVTIPQDRIKAEREKAVVEAVKGAEVDGFRKGQAPRHLVEPRLDTGEINGRVINQLLPEAFSSVVKEHLLKPITDPKVEIKEFDYEKGLTFEATIAERPEVKLGNYRQALKDLGARKGTGKSAVVYGPDGQPATSSTSGSEKESTDKLSVGEVMETLIKTASIDLPPLLAEQEVARMMSRLLEQTQALGISIEQYLQSIQKSADDLRLDYTKMAEANLKAEFILQEIAKQEEVVVKEEEINEAVQAAPDESTRAELEKPENKLYLASVLQKSKTIQKLMELAGGQKSIKNG